jgi:LEM3 (ligand-effect modulator 3) family / CDC50 family
MNTMLIPTGNAQITQITLDYTNCFNAGANFTGTSAQFVDMPSSAVSYQLKNPKQTFANPQWSFQALPQPAATDVANIVKRNQCRLRFELPEDLPAPVFMYYKLTNFFQNHRRYVQSLDVNQLKGSNVGANTLQNGNCRPLGSDPANSSIAIYPCGLIANSLFNGALDFTAQPWHALLMNERVNGTFIPTQTP